jgi:hypothetical protein
MLSRATRSYLLRVGVALGSSVLLSGCDQWALSIDSNGLLFISITSDGGQRQGGFRVRATQSGGLSRVMDVPTSGRLSLDGFSAGQVEVTLLPPLGCQVSSPNPQALQVGTGGGVNATFNVRCAPNS